MEPWESLRNIVASRFRGQEDRPTLFLLKEARNKLLDQALVMQELINRLEGVSDHQDGKP